MPTLYDVPTPDAAAYEGARASYTAAGHPDAVIPLPGEPWTPGPDGRLRVRASDGRVHGFIGADDIFTPDTPGRPV